LPIEYDEAWCYDGKVGGGRLKYCSSASVVEITT
jgi:hypothetical protein